MSAFDFIDRLINLICDPQVRLAVLAGFIVAGLIVFGILTFLAYLLNLPLGPALDIR